MYKTLGRPTALSTSNSKFYIQRKWSLNFETQKDCDDLYNKIDNVKFKSKCKNNASLMNDALDALEEKILLEKNRG